MNVQDCIDRGWLLKEQPKSDVIEKELKEAEYDLKRAANALKEKDCKWTIVMSYYSMFHSAKALCFKEGYREKKHIAVLVVLEDLNKKGKLEGKFVTYFRAAISERENADYRYSYSEEDAKELYNIAGSFNQRAKDLLKSMKK